MNEKIFLWLDPLNRAFDRNAGDNVCRFTAVSKNGNLNRQRMRRCLEGQGTVYLLTNILINLADLTTEEEFMSMWKECGCNIVDPR